MAHEITGSLDELLDVGGRDVLDVGCGEGSVARRLAAAGARVVGVDPLASVLDEARRETDAGLAVRYVQGVAEALEFPDQSFDVVVFFNSLHHVPPQSMDAALAESARVLRHGGLLYVQEPLPEGPLFEMVRSVEDETRVRAAAQEALARALDGRFTELARRETTTAMRMADFEAFHARMVRVEPERAGMIERHEAELRAAFERLGRPGANGYEFDQPFRACLAAVAAA